MREFDLVVDVVIGGAAAVVANPDKITAENQIRSGFTDLKKNYIMYKYLPGQR